MSTTHANGSPHRRDFLKAAAVGSAAALAFPAGAHAGGSDLIRVGLIGCGGRGTGAAAQCVRGANVKLVAMADAFTDRVNAARSNLLNDASLDGKIDVPPEHCFAGLDAYRHVLPLCDLVILATPPGFRPLHLQAAIGAGKHVFTEKPVAVDGPGVRTCLALAEEATRRRLAVVAGTQRRYQTSYRQSMERIHRGDLGTLLAGRCYWNQGRLWHRAQVPGMGDLEWQLRNWLYFAWLSGDHICEQHVHNLDVINWAVNGHPVRCVGMGGRQVRTAPEFGHIFDHFAVDYEYPNGFRLMSMCRQIEGCVHNISEAVVGTRGAWASTNPASPNFYRITGEVPWTFHRQNDNRPYEHEHVELLASIRGGRPINDLRTVAESTLTAIMGRTAAYTGQAVTWQDALNSTETLMPANLHWGMSLAVPPVPMPGD
jgi:predicted dehydrogenase